MRLVYFISLHKDAKQFHWLFEAIYDSRDVFAIHVDSKSPDSFVAQVRRIVGERPNVRFMQRRSVIWGGWSMCQIELDAMAALISDGTDWDFFINLSGQDYPLVGRERLVDELRAAAPASYVQMLPLGELSWRFRQRRRWLCVERNGRMRRLPVPVLPRRDVPVRHYGSMWHILHQNFCQWIVSSPTADKVAAHVRKMKIPDEFLFQTLASIGGFPVVSDCKREIVWTGKPHPETLTMADLPRLTSSTAFFARKFDHRWEREVLVALEKRLHAPPTITADAPSDQLGLAHSD